MTLMMYPYPPPPHPQMQPGPVFSLEHSKMEVSIKTQTCIGREMKSCTLNGARSINRITLTMLYGQMSVLFSLRLIEERAAGRLTNTLVPKPKPW